MDVRKIKDLLHAWRPGQDVPREVAHAREIAAKDKELSAWLENERAFDKAFSAKLNEVQPPSDLLERIIAAHESGQDKVVLFPQEETPRTERRSQLMRYGISIAASFAIVGSLVLFASHARNSSSDELAEFVDATVIRALAESAEMEESHSMANVVLGLRGENAPVPEGMPQELANLDPDSFGVIHTQKGNIGQVGFSNNDSYRLIVVERRCLGGCDKQLTKPVIHNLGDKIAVTWAKGSQVYILVSDKTDEPMIRNVAQSAGTSM